ncbi:beta-fructofuranosidase [Kandleria vitulina]|uniref:Sucrose-6-phosphate hydrolase n=1 Tax=Kandleria vitulina TaxID=1630 RepID=A0A1H2UW01_9FIRM|nr:sucrose-6-phosphate hydrolase [Kandleria vitulina]SDW60256.1 beta-fructofuranosidase [Kandleria vitulina]
MNVNKKYMPTYHAHVSSGWSNDPNGLIYFNGKYHMFFQHYPHKAKWGIMHWGHFISDDLIKWEEAPVALVPDQEYERQCGCCSGTAIERDGKLYLMYTAAQMDLQRQCIAYSEDGIHFSKLDNPLIDARNLNTSDISPKDFRDPKVFKKDDTYYCIAGTRMMSEEDYQNYIDFVSNQNENKEITIDDVASTNFYAHGYGNLVLLKSDDFNNWEYVGPLLTKQENIQEAFYRLNGVYECPDYFEVDGQELLLASPQNLLQIGYRFQNLHSCVYIPGHLDFTTGDFHPEYIEEIDSGFDFYAPQCMKMTDGRYVMIAWKEMWDRTYPTESDNWIGTYTLPRELSYKDGQLIQIPIRELENYRQNEVVAKGMILNGELRLEGVEGNKIELEVDMEITTASRAGIKLFKHGDHEVFIYYDQKEQLFVFDRSCSGIEIGGREIDTNIRKMPWENKRIQLRMFLDVSSLEIFIDGGKKTMTGNIYGDPIKDTGVEFFSEDGECIIHSVKKYDIVVEA